MLESASLGGAARALVRLVVGAALGAGPGALYAGLVAGVHWAVYGRWDRVPAFAVGCLAVGALVGLSAALAAEWPRRPRPGQGQSCPVGPAVAAPRRPCRTGTRSLGRAVPAWRRARFHPVRRVRG
jgi:hypothetical protein